MDTPGSEIALLNGLRVLELASGIAGPLVGQVLADYGAEVVKIEAGDGDYARALPGFLAWNRGKQSLVGAAGDERISALLAGADVCIVDDLGRVPFGIDLVAARALNPGLIVVETPPYEGAAPWRGSRESEVLLSAATGVALRQSSTDGGPVECVTPIILNAQGYWAATCTLAALIDRQESGFGQVVTVSGVHALAYVSAGALTKDPTQAEQASAVGSGGPNPFYTRYRAGDGRWVFAGALVHDAQLRYLSVLGLADLVKDPRAGGSTQAMIIPKYREFVRARFAEAYLTRTRDEWLEMFEAADVPCGPLLTRDEWLDHPQLRETGLRIEVNDELRGTVVMPAPAIVASRQPPAIRRSAPRLGEHDASPPTWPARPRPAGEPRSRPGPLAGRRVVDLGTYLAGPYAGVLLSELGADVLKVEMLTGDPFRAAGFTYNRGMRSLAVDLRNEEGTAILHDLVRASDAVLDNGRLGAMKRLQADYESLAAVKPDVVTSSVTGFGEAGPLARKPAFDLVLQAMSGMMLAQGGEDEPVIVTISINDVTAAIFCALGACLGIYERARSGRGQRFTTSLAAAATSVQSGDYVRYAGGPSPRVGARDFRGTDAAHRYIQVADGWIRVEEDGDAPPGELTQDALGGLTRTEAVNCLAARGITATAARPFADLRADPELTKLEFTHTFQRSDGTTYMTPGRLARFGRTQLTRKLVCPGVGEHTRQILLDTGVHPDRVDALLAAGVVRQGEPMDPVIFNYR